MGMLVNFEIVGNSPLHKKWNYEGGLGFRLNFIPVVGDIINFSQLYSCTDEIIKDFIRYNFINFAKRFDYEIYKCEKV